VEEVSAESTGSIPLGRYGKPEEYADVVTFLASERAAYLTGSVIRVDGGLIASIRKYLTSCRCIGQVGQTAHYAGRMKMGLDEKTIETLSGITTATLDDSVTEKRPSQCLAARRQAAAYPGQKASLGRLLRCALFPRVKI
jgi:hypothetical protein